MGRGRAKAKKLSMTNQDDACGEEEKIPAQNKRGRPQKSLKDEIDEEEARRIEDESSEDTTEAPNKDSKNKTVAQNGKKRIKNGKTKEKSDSVNEENGNATRIITEESDNGFRQNGNRRKSKPHRAAEAVVECN